MTDDAAADDLFTAVVARLRAAGCVFAEDEARLLLDHSHSPAELDGLIARRVAGEPVEVVVGWAEFHGLRVEVDPGVFVPRRRTEFLVDLMTPPVHPGSVVVDLCCGTGALGLAVAMAVPQVELHAADIDPTAVRCAARNVATVGGQVHLGDLFAALPAALAGRVDLVLLNAPYVPTSDIAFLPPEAREYEPALALDGGADGVAVHRAAASQATSWLGVGGQIAIETSPSQAPLTAAALTAAGLHPRIEIAPDGDTCVVVGSRLRGSSNATR